MLSYNDIAAAFFERAVHLAHVHAENVQNSQKCIFGNWKCSGGIEFLSLHVPFYQLQDPVFGNNLLLKLLYRELFTILQAHDQRQNNIFILWCFSFSVKNKTRKRYESVLRAKKNRQKVNEYYTALV